MAVCVPLYLVYPLWQLCSGEDGLLAIWNLDSGELLQAVTCVFNGPVTSVIWITPSNEDDQAFAFGCADGTIHIYSQPDADVSVIPSSVSTLLILAQSNFIFASLTTAHKMSIEDLDFDGDHRRLASVGDGALQVWILGDHCNIDSPPLVFYWLNLYSADKLTGIPSPPPGKPLIARNVLFADRGETIIVFYLESHDMYVPFGRNPPWLTMI